MAEHTEPTVKEPVVETSKETLAKDSAVETVNAKEAAAPVVEKKGSPFLKKNLARAPELEVDTEVEKATAEKQSSEIDKIIGEKCLFTAKVQLYFLSTKTKSLETRGEGKLSIAQDKAGLYKIIMVRNKLMLLGCNHYVAPGCSLSKAKQAPRSWAWVAKNDKSDAEVNEPLTTYFVTLATEEESEEFSKKYKEAQEMNTRKFEEMRKTAVADKK